jgi:hypothetical protein
MWLAGRLAVAFLAVVSSAALATEFRARLFGHEVVIAKSGFDDQLSVNGRVLQKSPILSISEMAVVSGVGVAIGRSGDGGNSCEASPFVLSFPAGDAARLDGPLDTCRPVSHDVMTGEISLNTRALPGKAGERWTWRPEEGFRATGTTSHSPNMRRGWAALRAREVTHPLDLYEYGEVAESIRGLLGSDEQAFLPALAGPGSIRFEGDLLVSRACMAHNCDRTGALLLADLQTRRLFLAWKPEVKPIVVRPAVGDWNGSARGQLRAWAAAWK